MGKLGLMFKLVALTILLVVVIVAIRGMTPEKMERAFSALGIEPGASGQAGFQAAGERPLAAGEERRTLCHTRLHSVQFPDGHAVIEINDGMKLDWVVRGPSVAAPGGRSIGYMAMEKWLSQHCQYAALILEKGSHPGEKADPLAGELVAKFQFIDQSELVLHRLDAGLVFSGGKELGYLRFQSLDLLAALSELRTLAALP